MNRKLFYVFVVCAFIALAVITVGGCGGSSSNKFSQTNGDDNGNQETDRLAVMVSAVNEENVEGSEIAPLVKDVVLFSGLNGDGRGSNGEEEDPLAVLADMVKEGGALFFDNSSFVSNNKINNIENVKAAFEAGAAIVMVYPTQAQVDYLFGELEVDGGSIIPEGSKNPHHEIVGVKKTSNGKSIYVMPHLANFSVSSENDDSELTPDEISSKKEFNRERLNGVVDWAKNKEIESSSVSSAEDDNDITRLSEVTHFTLDFSYNGADQDEDSAKNFYNKIGYDVYSCHSFEREKDYFIIEMNSQASPKKQAAHKVITVDRSLSSSGGRTIKCTLDSAVGYLSSMKFDNQLKFDYDEDANAFLVDSKPETQKSDVADKHENISANFGNAVAYKPVGHGRYFPEFNNVVYNKDLIHSVEGFTVNADETTWDLAFPLPKDGEEVVGDTASASYQKVEPAESSMISRNDRMVYIYEIDRSVLRANKNKLILSTGVTAKHGQTEGNAYNNDPDKHEYLIPRTDKTWYTSEKTMKIQLPLPPTLGTSASLFYAGSAKAAYGFQILSDSDWSIETPKWMKANPSSGKATGKTLQNITLNYEANDQSTQRSANIVIRHDNGEKIYIPFYQAGK